MTNSCAVAIGSGIVALSIGWFGKRVRRNSQKAEGVNVQQSASPVVTANPSFIPPQDEWIRSHVEDIPNQVCNFSGDISNLEILDVGCGDMLGDVGFLSRGIKHLTGLDVHTDLDVIERSAHRVHEAGFSVAEDYRSRLSYVPYDGVKFPFQENQFDFVMSWSAFEHIAAVPEVLREARRVVKPQGRVFIQVYSWFHCFWGSHLTDYIDEPYFHLRRPPEWVRARLEDYAAAHPENGDFILGHMWHEYGHLNRYSARLFLKDVIEAGFSIERMQSITRNEHIAAAPPEVALPDLISCGTFLLLLPAK